ncbi:4-hydroxy-tetrahydrodipicolinate reductase [Mucilaginibacter achroorhodeus]|uniref:4-hydroxy-tetrahydrodipicolinate reductase n=1 Tax=Mucilaginibacter achroorhodeus TaxID=2599294 RepID=A0A563UAF0_9SPHI|nr:4-hydroxy-tetrahydrodipicolinate reductase [Mucilaginibacter achroorhodeus]TWR28362.1 4-hydroxy-tetrahydrodipicolinate reductase [Mucilaginibacter achroorhodeus]
MKIALLGYGKMGKMIEQIALSRRHEIVLKIDKDNIDELTAENLQKADVAIEFSTPSTVLSNIELCFSAGVPVVVGTTGWHNEMEQIKEQCEFNNASLIYGTNFSVGVNIFFHVNKMLARIMNNYPYYEVQVEEIHHTQKLDSPSGTAITIAEGIIDNLESKQNWKNVLVGDDHPNTEVTPANEVLIESLRIESVPGTHTVIYDSEVDTIEFKHTAHNRNGFALGAVLAAEWIQDKKGFHSIEEMFDFNK